MSDTPETDAARVRIQNQYENGKLDIGIEQTLLDMAEMERERDEARAEAEKWRDMWNHDELRLVIPKPKLPWEK